MALYQIAEYTGFEVIQLTDAKAYLRVDFIDDDTYIEQLIKMARIKVTRDTHYPVVLTAIQENFRSWPLNRNTIQTLQFNGIFEGTPVVKYFNEANVETTLLDTNYRLLNNNGLLQIQFINTFNFFDRDDAISVSYSVKPQGEQVEPLKIAMLMLIQHYYDNRTAVSYLKVNEMPLGYKNLINQYKNYIW